MGSVTSDVKASVHCAGLWAGCVQCAHLRLETTVVRAGLSPGLDEQSYPSQCLNWIRRKTQDGLRAARSFWVHPRREGGREV